jgi:ligand-binding SRPBCC domain-containing protein
MSNEYMSIYTLECEMIVQRSLSDVFPVFEDPHNLAKITPPWLSFQVLSRTPLEMRKGAEIQYTIRWLGLSMRWNTLITEFVPPVLFVDEQVEGPYKQWRHRHTFAETGQGTRIGDRVDYSLPMGIGGRLAHGFLVGRQLRQIFAYRQRKLSEIFGGATLQTIAPGIRRRPDAINA